MALTDHKRSLELKYQTNLDEVRMNLKETTKNVTNLEESFKQLIVAFGQGRIENESLLRAITTIEEKITIERGKLQSCRIPIFKTRSKRTTFRLLSYWKKTKFKEASCNFYSDNSNILSGLVSYTDRPLPTLIVDLIKNLPALKEFEKRVDSKCWTLSKSELNGLGIFLCHHHFSQPTVLNVVDGARTFHLFLKKIIRYLKKRITQLIRKRVVQFRRDLRQLHTRLLRFHFKSMDDCSHHTLLLVPLPASTISFHRNNYIHEKERNYCESGIYI